MTWSRTMLAKLPNPPRYSPEYDFISEDVRYFSKRLATALKIPVRISNVSNHDGKRE